MKAVILAGGFGTRICELTANRPKPLVEIGGKPLLWHLMKSYEAHGINDFIVCCGYLADQIHAYFASRHLHGAAVTYDLKHHRHVIHHTQADPWTVTCVDTGTHTMTGGRLARVAPYLDPEPFCMTYGDGLSDVDLTSAILFHNSHGKAATVCAVRRANPYGTMCLSPDDDQVLDYSEKPVEGQPWINAGVFVLNPSVLNLIDNDQTIWEREPIESLAASGELMAWRHDGFWKSMDTLKDHREFEALVAGGSCPWLSPLVPHPEVSLSPTPHSPTIP